VENISPLLQIGVQLLFSTGGGWRLFCRAQDSNARDISRAIFWAQPILHELLWSYFLGEAYLLELVVLHLFVLITLDIKIPPTKGLSNFL